MFDRIIFDNRWQTAITSLLQSHRIISGAHVLLPGAESAPDGGVEPHRFLASSRPRDGKSAELCSRKHTAARENLMELIMRPHTLCFRRHVSNEAQSSRILA